MATILEERVDVVEARVDRLEVIFGQFMVQTGMAIQRMDRTIERLDRSIERMDRTIERMDRSIERIEATIVEMKAEATSERREINKRWGELARKQGTLVEDLIAPGLRRIARDELGCGDVRFFAERVLRIRSDDPSRRREFDALYVGEFAVLLNETKSSPRAEDAQAFLDFLRSGEFARYFPEYRDLPIVPVFSSLYLPADLVTFLSRNRIYAVAMGEEAMQVLNRDQVQQAAA